MPSDPYAEFGGKAQADPYAEFGSGAAKGQPQSAPPQSTPQRDPLDSALNAIQNWWDQVNPVSQVQGAANAIRHPLNTASAMGQQNAQLWQRAKDAYNQGHYSEAAAHMLNYALNGIPGIGASMDEAGQKFANGDVSGGIGHTLGIATNVLASAKGPAVAGKVGEGVKNFAGDMAESALGIRGTDRAFGKTPGQAALEDTNGLRPSKVAESARHKVSQLNTDLEQRAAAADAAGIKSSLKPARDVITKRQAQAAAGNSATTPADLQELSDQLTKPQPGFSGAVDPATGQVAEQQSPSDMLRMKREFGNDFTKWNQLHPNRDMKTARGAYHQMDKELDNAIPGSDGLNQRISSLLPVAERAENTELNAGPAQNLAHKLKAHTGALTGMVAGAGAGTMAGGPVGGIIGGTVGLVAPDLVTSPAVQMGAARATYGTGRALASPASAAAMRGAPLVRDPLGLAQYLDQNQDHTQE